MYEYLIFDESNKLIEIKYYQNNYDFKCKEGCTYIKNTAIKMSNYCVFHQSLNYFDFAIILREYNAEDIPISIVALMCDEAANNRRYRDLVINIFQANFAIENIDKEFSENLMKFFVIFSETVTKILEKNIAAFSDTSKSMLKDFNKNEEN